MLLMSSGSGMSASFLDLLQFSSWRLGTWCCVGLGWNNNPVRVFGTRRIPGCSSEMWRVYRRNFSPQVPVARAF
jgi:hypothetical protein